MVVRFDKSSGEFEEKCVKDLDASFSAFKAALYLWRMSSLQQFDNSTGREASPQ